MLQLIFDAVLRMSIQGVVIFTIVFLLRFLLIKLHISHKYIVVLWMILFFYLVFPWKLELPIGFWNDSAVQWSDNNMVKEQYAEEEIQGESEITAPVYVGDMPVLDMDIAEDMSITEDMSIVDNVNESTIDYEEVVQDGEVSRNGRSFWTQIKETLPYLWCVVGIAFCGHFIWSYIAIRRRLSIAEKGEADIYYVQDIATPMAFGVIKPRIYLPVNLEENNLFYVLSHEKMHIKRGDHILKIAAYVVCIVHWFNPMVWVAYHILGDDIEMACDEAVVRTIGGEKKKEYANALLLAAEGKSGRGKRIFVAPICFDEGNVKLRIKNIIKYKYTLPIVGTIVLVVALALGVVFLTKGETDNLSNEENSVVNAEEVSEVSGIDSQEDENMTNSDAQMIAGDPYYIESETMCRVGFQNLLGYEGYFITHKDSTPMETTYYAVEGDETFIIAQSWGFEREDYFIDIDGDGTRELICNVYSGDGGQDTLIYRRFEDGIRVAYASQLLDKEYDNVGVYSLVTWYDVAYDRLEIAYWMEDLQDYEYAYYDLNLEALSWYRPDIPQNGVCTLKSMIFYADDAMIEAAAIGKELGDYDLYGVKEIDVYINDSLSQTLIMQEAIEKDGIPMVEEGYTRCLESIADECLIKTVDINFDGYLDLQVFAWNTKDDDWYYYYCWNPNESKFEYAFCLNEPEIDVENQLLITYNLVSRYEMYHYNYYKVNEDNILELVNTVEAPVEDTGY